jgi:GNAT superfamily N-acetyltransferase
LLTYKRITEKSLAVSICRHLWHHNFVRRTAKDILRSPHYAIYEENTLVGWIGYRRVREKQYEIQHLTVLPEARQRGIGKAAVSYVVGLLRERGADSCHAYIRPTNIPSIRLFYGQGFKWTDGNRMRKYTLDLKQKGRSFLLHEEQSCPCRNPPSDCEITWPPLAGRKQT